MACMTAGLRLARRMRPLDELLEKQEPAWPHVKEWLREAKNKVSVLRPSDPQRGEALHKLQVTTRSPMGAIVYETGGILVDHGWVRVLGSGHARLPRSMPDWNHGRTWTKLDAPPPCLLVADDVVGGFFAINGGAFQGPPGNVFYFAPDAMQWEDTEKGYTDFVRFVLLGDLARFYESQRWPGWEQEVAALPGDRAIAIYPPLWAKGPPVGERHRGVVPIAEMFTAAVDFVRQMHAQKRRR